MLRLRTRALPLVVLACAALLTGCSGKQGTEGAGAVSPALKVVDPGPSGLFPAGQRQAAPEVKGTTLDGKALDVASLHGKVVVLNFWASWCAPCRAESPGLVAVAERHAADVQFVGVNVKDQDTAARAFERRQAVPYPSLYDQPGVLLTRFRGLAPQTPPTTLLLDRDGRIAGRFVGGVTQGELEGPLQTLLAEPA